MKQRYSPKVAELLALCTRNYASLQRLLTQARRVNGELERFHWHHKTQAITIELALCEQTKYTEVVKLTRHDESTKHLDAPSIDLRLYHDAQLAEVLTGQHFSRFLPVYPYPNASMLQRNEKFQVNLFVTELLGQFQHRDWLLMTIQESRKS
ncbi:DUF1249 domain-containing protein [Ferrimonas lipolytica]|uniref:DUF1249 domain-containing protein n=2 Tax=Ferrimonas lipolytica TaxID=2724191 RepID=A0A6H1UHI3_9GAMM|nr:DUF1249 domain-containing protein [Ferrimonas lipolytica]